MVGGIALNLDASGQIVIVNDDAGASALKGEDDVLDYKFWMLPLESFDGFRREDVDFHRECC